MTHKYLVIGKEIGESGTPHLQGYVVFDQPVRLNALKRISPRAHFEIAKGTTEQNRTYCTKDNDFAESGVIPLTAKEKGQMEKDRWALIISHAKAGTLEEHDPKMFYLHYNTNLKLQSKFEVPEFIDRQIEVFWGPTATGKSHKAWIDAGSSAYVKDPRSKFWYGYHGQENIIIDEFRGGIDISHMLRWLDKYPMLVEVKGSSCALKAKRIWITSNLHPKDWYPDLDQETISALLRRLKVTHFNKLM